MHSLEVTWNVQPFHCFYTRKLTHYFYLKIQPSKYLNSNVFYLLKTAAHEMFFLQLSTEGRVKKKRLILAKTFLPSALACLLIHTYSKLTKTSFLFWAKTSSWFFGLSRRKHMVEGAHTLWKEKATEPENNSKMCTGIQQLNLKAAEKLLGCYEQKVWFQSIILVIHYVLCKRLWGLGLISIISLHCK